jgi:predicted Zn-dependent protease
MAAFAQSVNFVVAERDLSKLKAIVNEAISENDQFYRVFREALHEAGKL